MRISDWSSDVCSYDLMNRGRGAADRTVDRQVAGGRRQRSACPTIDRTGHRQGLRIGQTEARRGEAAPRADVVEIGRASCRARVCPYVSISVVAVTVKETKDT